MNVKSYGYLENRPFQLKSDLFFDKIVHLSDEGNMQKNHSKVCCCFYKYESKISY